MGPQTVILLDADEGRRSAVAAAIEAAGVQVLQTAHAEAIADIAAAVQVDAVVGATNGRLPLAVYAQDEWPEQVALRVLDAVECRPASRAA
jgi:hypothetical protein